MITDADPIFEQRSKPKGSKQRKPFIVDAPAPMLRRSNALKLSKHARHLYMTMRALANGRTGELRIRDRWLRAEYIGREADMCRNVRLRSMRELIAAGYVSVFRERVLQIINGRRRVVMGRCHYCVHRNPIDVKKPEKPQILLKSLSCTVQEKDPQYVSNPPGSAVPDVECGSSKGCAGDGYTSSESPQALTQIDDDVSPPNNEQICEETTKEKDLKPETRAWIRSRILSRAGCHIRNVHSFLRAAIPDFFENLESEVEEYLTLIAVDCMRAKLEQDDSVGFDDVFPAIHEEAKKHALSNAEAFFDLAYESAADALGLKDSDEAIAERHHQERVTKAAGHGK